MALHDEEQRQLEEIERRLAEDDPRLAQRLEKLRPLGVSRIGLAILGMLALFVGGLVTIAIGAEISSPVLGIVGVVLAVGLPTVIIWRLWLRRLR
ncbi:DUF3040 domain-containing protein [Prauserella sp. PE36]|uniref:DUF3040 domain-containing protein n=1 Tax=Prauserella endophytica TaxID=1592324 RepID=A0ABY2S023_9PSEU|nr:MULTISPECIES: DUF3040 domain-containing protein [Prauserella]PXY20366.1 hypothetical protein BAY59_31510 [Prauserella coralliicola]RBM17338.1 DUF3040 domain-containing protein [Prauserella sp. PE36]TKG66970.1 DUF3040 domain-containing protein [Prauserella endophytica]